VGGWPHWGRRFAPRSSTRLPTRPMGLAITPDIDIRWNKVTPALQPCRGWPDRERLPARCSHPGFRPTRAAHLMGPARLRCRGWEGLPGTGSPAGSRAWASTVVTVSWLATGPHPLRRDRRDRRRSARPSHPVRLEPATGRVPQCRLRLPRRPGRHLQYSALGPCWTVQVGSMPRPAPADLRSALPLSVRRARRSGLFLGQGEEAIEAAPHVFGAHPEHDPADAGGAQDPGRAL
jgi:hypothetical protein